MTEPQINAILLDVGGPLVDDSGIDLYWNDYLIKALPEHIGRPVTIEEIQATNRKVIAAYTPSLYSGALWQFVKPDLAAFKRLRGAFDGLDLYRFYKLRPEAVEICRELSEKYLLAIAANQPASTRGYLENCGLLKYFKFHKMSGELPYSKPDIRFFQQICEELSVLPGQAVMVGDRQDNDMVPAKGLGLKTVRMMVGTHLEQEPRMPSEIPDRTILSLSELPSAISDLQKPADYL